MVVEVIAGCTRAVVRKIAAEVPSFVQMERKGNLVAALASGRNRLDRSAGQPLRSSP